MSARPRIAAAILAVTATITGLCAAPASAALTTWTVTDGGHYSLANLSGPELQDVTAHSHILCNVQTGTASLSFKMGTGLANPLGRVSTLSYPGPVCNGSTLTADGLPWPIRATSYNGDTFGKILHIHLTLSGSCNAAVDGTSGSADDGWMKFGYENPATTGGAGNFATDIPGSPDSNLHFYDVTKCPGIHDGDRVAFRFVMAVINSKGLSPTITSP